MCVVFDKPKTAVKINTSLNVKVCYVHVGYIFKLHVYMYIPLIFVILNYPNELSCMMCVHVCWLIYFAFVNLLTVQWSFFLLL